VEGGWIGLSLEEHSLGLVGACELLFDFETQEFPQSVNMLKWPSEKDSRYSPSARKREFEPQHQH